MSLYTPPSIRTVREDVQGSVVLTGGEVVPLLIGTATGKVNTNTGLSVNMGNTTLFAFGNLGIVGPVVSLLEVRSRLSGGILYASGTDFTFNQTNQTLDWSISPALASPYLLSATLQTGTSSLVNGTTYYYVITALRDLDLNGPITGETIASNEQSVMVTATGQQILLTWSAVVGAKSYRIYRSTLQGNYAGASLLATVTGQFSTTFTDPGTATVVGSPPGLPTNGKVVALNPPPYALSPGFTLTAKVDGGLTQTATFTATNAQRNGTGITYPVTIVGGTNDTISIKINGGAAQVITLTAGSRTLNDILADINGTLVGGSAVNFGGQLGIRSDRQGSASSVEVVGGTSLVTLGLTAGVTTGTGNVADILFVTAAEVAAMLTAAITGATASVSGSGFPQLQTNTVGGAGSIQITGGTANTAINFPVTIFFGATATAGTALRRPAINTAGGAAVGEAFFVTYTYVTTDYFNIKRFTSLGTLIAEYGLGSNLAIAGTLAMAGAGRGNNAPIVLAMAIPADNLFTMQTALSEFASKRKDINLVVPLSTVAGVNTAVRAHVDLMSDVNHARERMGIVGLPIGTQVGDVTTSGTAIFSAAGLADRRMVLTYPWIVADVQRSDGTVAETLLDGWATSVVVAGLIASLPDRAEPPTSKIVGGVKRLGIQLDEQDENLLGAAGITVLTEDQGNFIVRDGITTSTANEPDQQININLTDDLLRTTLRSTFASFKGRKLLPQVIPQIRRTTNAVLQQFVKFELIVGFDAASIEVTQDSDIHTKVNVRFSYQPTFPLRQIEFRIGFQLQAAPLAG